jgi:hypothetical protein
MKEVCHKNFSKRFLFVFEISIYSEDRYSEDEVSEYWNSLYKHFVHIYIFKWKVFSTHWMTGTYINGNTAFGKFYEKGK